MNEILVIEDEQDIRLNLVKALEYEGFGVIGAENGRVGVELAKKHLPDLIICDIIMPELSGYGVLIELRKNQHTATIPFIFLTAKTAKEDFRKGIQLGADAYLTKPFDIDELIAVVNTTLLKRETDVSKQLGTLRLDLAQTLPFGLQAPLTGIIGFSGLLAELGLEMLPGLNEILEIQTYIYENALRLKRFMGNYLLYHELKFREYDPEKKKRWQQRVSVLTKDVIASLAEEKAHEVKREGDLAVELVEAEIQIFPGSLQKLVEELLDNAFRFSQPKTPVRVTTTIDGKQFILKIMNQGPGMVEEPSLNLTEQLFSEKSLYEHQGVGLGLPICRLLAQLHGGALTIESKSNQGTTITVVFN
jgi:CheY-like chemotaxis protein